MGVTVGPDNQELKLSVGSYFRILQVPATTYKIDSLMTHPASREAIHVCSKIPGILLGT